MNVDSGANDRFAPTRQVLNRALHAPGEIYASPEVLRREIQEYFMRDWLYVARVEELANPGDYMALRPAGEPIIVSRDRTGQLHAFYNMCIHRGVQVAHGSGNARSFRCPYHGWGYDLSGRLTGATFMKESEGFDPVGCRMRPLLLDVWRGNIFVNFDVQARPLAEFIAEFEKEFAMLGMENCRLGNKIEIEVECNWKFVHENLMDFYHVRVLHAKTFGAKFSWTNDNVTLKPDGGLSIWYDAGPPTPGAEPLLGKMPWLADKPDSFACTGFLAPNFTIFGRIDCVRPMIAWPLSVDRTRLIIYQLFPESFFERADFQHKLKIYRDYQVQVLEEDRTMIESMQKAMSSPAYVPGRMSVLEKPLHNFLNGYIERIFGAREAAE
ncbi:MAG TPA: aromatic ring-hydroxylating dioxygenase subunit alpha [Vineibacter sp.]|nr:aromatic ring-hydroxylating dioxygenase subunit alpha [Vineibacter sp.]